MQFDLGIAGFGLLILVSLAFGVVVQLIGKPGTSVDGLIAGMGWFVGALVASELVGVDVGARVVDGLALDAVVVGGGLIGVPLALVLRLYGDRRSRNHPASI
ncbi:MAG: hypothetical protein FIA92_05735 [Chloroflexi bacterium]|nr:hypothetical protein [Chloroflexota bacterium]